MPERETPGVFATGAKGQDRDKEIILLRFFKEKTQTEVAKILGISQVQVSRIERKVLNEMKSKLTSA